MSPTLTTSHRDLKDATNPDLQVRNALAAHIRDACINVGFFYGSALPFTTPHPVSSSSVSNHGIPESVVEQTLDAAKSFFALPLSTKEEVVEPNHPPALPR
jgi:isopenicillin N synthase-like dioxygenase